MNPWSLYWIILLILSQISQPEKPSHPPLFLTAYWWDPALPGPNCNDDCGYVATGLNTAKIPTGVAAACPSEWLGLPVRNLTTGKILEWHTTRLYFPEDSGLSPRWCVDAFGDSENRKMVQINWRGEATWVYRVDLANDNLSINHNTQMIYGNWYRRWEPVPIEWYQP